MRLRLNPSSRTYQHWSNMFERSEIDFAKVTCMPYRTATVRDVVMSLPRREPTGVQLEAELIAAAGVTQDNHVVYVAVAHDGTKLYYACSDYMIRLGLKIDEHSC